MLKIVLKKKRKVSDEAPEGITQENQQKGTHKWSKGSESIWLDL